MKKIFTLGLLLFAGAGTVNAQCASCTATLNGSSSVNYFLIAGQKLCITTSGSATGLITVSGGTLCNQGHITTSKVLVTGGGDFQNYGTVNIDSLLVTGTGSVFSNHGHATHVRMATTDHAVSSNYYSMIADYVGDSLGSFYNNGSLSINQSFYNSYSSIFENNGYMGVQQDFLNSANSSFETKCMINVGHDWYNSATITGLGGMDCGGFRIANGSYNSGTVTAVGGPMDLCDAGNTTHIDANTGLIATDVTYCVCNNDCIAPVGIEELSKNEQMDLFPNPSNGLIHLRYSRKPDLVEIYSSMGQLLLSVKNDAPYAADEMEIHTESLPQGVYFLRAKDRDNMVFSSTFIKE